MPGTQTADQIAAKNARQKGNELSAAYFAASILAFIALFTIVNWADIALHRYSSSKGGFALNKLASFARRLRSIFTRKVPGFTNAGHFVVFIIYLAVNICLSFQNVDWSGGTLNNWAKRMGWITSMNIALLAFLGLKNTPLSPLTSQSYAAILPLHQAAGYTTIALMLVHSSVYIAAWKASNSLEELLELSNVMGIVSGLSMLVLFVSVFVFLRSRYELFYVIHVTLFILIVIGVGTHRPAVSQNAVWMPIFTGTIWSLDRLVRLSFTAWNTYANTATLTALPHAGVHIALSRSSSRAVAGEHTLLWIPAIRAMETHPFTITSTKPLEFVVKAHDGFTKELRAYALKNENKPVRAGLHGPYGKVPNLATYDKILFVAGGSGASFTFGLAVDLLKKLEENTAKKIHFVWVIRDKAQLTWFTKPLQQLSASRSVTLTIHISNPPSLTEPPSSPSPSNPSSTSLSDKSNSAIDIEKSLPSTLTTGPEITTHNGRPNLPALVQSEIASTCAGQSIAVAACGPRGMMSELRHAVATSKVTDRSVRLFCEEFGW